MFAILCAGSCLLKIRVGAKVAAIQTLERRIITTVIGQISQRYRTTSSKLTVHSFKGFMLKVEINAGGGLVQMFTGDNCTFLLARLLYHIKQQCKKLKSDSVKAF